MKDVKVKFSRMHSHILIWISCTAPNVVSNLTVTAHSTRLLYVAWERPVTPPVKDENVPSLTYNVLVNGTYYNSTADDTTSISIPGLIPNTSYHIEVRFRP